MRCGKSLSDGRALAFAAALLAISLNFLQPLAHAAVMRGGAPDTLWSVFCKVERDTRPDAPLVAETHECCLGLAHAASFPSPAMAFATVGPIAPAIRPLPSLNQPTAVGLRDGPHRPRGPPSFV